MRVPRGGKGKSPSPSQSQIWTFAVNLIHVRMVSASIGARAVPRRALGARYGRAVVEAALGRLHDLDLEGRGVTHCLFETAIPAFYERLGARQLAKDLVINSTGDGVAFEDEFVMVFPKSKPWPEGTIDLRGPGY